MPHKNTRTMRIHAREKKQDMEENVYMQKYEADRMISPFETQRNNIKLQQTISHV